MRINRLNVVFQSVVDFLSNDGVFAITAILGIGLSFIDFFADTEKILGKSYQAIILMMVGLIAFSLWKWRGDSNRQKQLFNEQLQDISRKFDKGLLEILNSAHDLSSIANDYKNSLSVLQDNSDLIDTLISLPEYDLSYVRESVEIHGQISNIRNLINPGGRQIIDDVLDMHRYKINSLALGAVSVPRWEAPIVNSLIMELFGKRMDAVSDRDLSFFAEDELGDNYYRMSVKSRGRKRMSVTRIFIIDLDDLINKKELLVKILSKHLLDGVAFGIAIHEDIESIENEYAELRISNGRALKRDFALFDRNKVISFFRKHNQKQFFKATFSTTEASHANNILIEDQRKLYKRLVCDCWLVSSNFKILVKDGLDEQEWSYVENKTKVYVDKIVASSTHKIEDPMFPLVVDSPDELASKIVQMYQLRIQVLGK
jgi:hypothetical protein